MYLAHYSVLERVHASVKSPAESTGARGMAVEQSAASPQEIHGLVDTGFEALTKELNEWRMRAAA
jgi:hypothetical protein